MIHQLSILMQFFLLVLSLLLPCNFGNGKYEQQMPAALPYKVARQPKVQSGWIQWVLVHHFHQFSQSFWVALKWTGKRFSFFPKQLVHVEGLVRGVKFGFVQGSRKSSLVRCPCVPKVSFTGAPCSFFERRPFFVTGVGLPDAYRALCFWWRVFLQPCKRWDFIVTAHG